MPFSLKLPLAKDDTYGLKMNLTARDAAKQNLRMLILTSPGERVMEPDFGVGIFNLLFEQNHSTLPGKIRERIYKQVDKYMPYIELVKVEIGNIEQDANSLSVVIEYKISSTGAIETLVVNPGA